VTTIEGLKSSFVVSVLFCMLPTTSLGDLNIILFMERFEKEDFSVRLYVENILNNSPNDIDTYK
jgi:hypothetical protein